MSGQSKENNSNSKERQKKIHLCPNSPVQTNMNYLQIKVNTCIWISARQTEQ